MSQKRKKKISSQTKKKKKIINIEEKKFLQFELVNRSKSEEGGKVKNIKENKEDLSLK